MGSTPCTVGSHLCFLWVMTRSKRGKEGRRERRRKEGTREEEWRGGGTVLGKTERWLKIKDRNKGVVVNV